VIQSILSPVIGLFSITLLFVNILFTAIFLFPVAFLKLILPFETAKKIINTVLNKIANDWVFRNNLILALTRKIDWNITGDSDFEKDGRYLVFSNHQSWVDIFVLQKVLYGKIPYIKFFLKKELIWVPIMGPAWWALDFPFMKRYSKELLKKKPHLKGKDIEITKKACEKFKIVPVTIMNFLEGTRFSQEIHDKQASPYKHLLKPKSGGVGFVMSSIGEYITGIIDVTIVYPTKSDINFWPFFCGLVKDIKVDIRNIPLTDSLIGDYNEDEKYRETFQQWLNDLWSEKDRKIEKMKKDF
jgi:1-acyl-sn-glycerol-3-phosphate acyltransferase